MCVALRDIILILHAAAAAAIHPNKVAYSSQYCCMNQHFPMTAELVMICPWSQPCSSLLVTRPASLPAIHDPAECLNQPVKIPTLQFLGSRAVVKGEKKNIFE